MNWASRLVSLVVTPIFWAFAISFWISRRIPARWFFTVAAIVYSALFVASVLHLMPTQLQLALEFRDLLVLGLGAVLFGILAVLSWIHRPKPLTDEDLRRSELDEIEGRRGRAERISREMSADDVIAAGQILPGFSDDLSTWRIVINRDGRLRQQIDLATSENNYREESAQKTALIAPEDVQAILAVANEIGFHNFNEYYEHEFDSVTDLQTCSITIRFGDEVKTVEAYGPDDIAREENNQDMVGFMRLWELIHRHAPYPGGENCLQDNNS